MADMVQRMSDDHKPLDPEAAAAIGKVRRLMIIIMTTTFVAIGVILAVIGYRLSQVKESAPSFVDVTMCCRRAPKCSRPRSAATTSW